MKRFCSLCGKEFEAEKASVRYCDECKEKVKQEAREKQKGYAKARAEKLGLVTLVIYKEDREILTNRAKAEGKTTADILREILENAKINADEPKAKKAAKKA